MSERLPHEWDDDGCCIHCGFDGAEEYHLRVMCVPAHSREPAPYYARFCNKRRAAEQGEAK